MKATYTVEKVTHDPLHISNGMVFIIDENIGMSITNDAEAVVADVVSKYPNHRIIYKDTDGSWDELLHWNGRFTGFKLFRRA